MGLSSCVEGYYIVHQPNKWESYPQECCLYSGLNDRKGNPIHEGDIVKDDEGEGIIIYYRPNKDFAVVYDRDVIMQIDGRYLEVVGSIYEKTETKWTENSFQKELYSIVC